MKRKLISVPIRANGCSHLESGEFINLLYTVIPSFLEYFKYNRRPPPHLSLMGSSVKIFFTFFNTFLMFPVRPLILWTFSFLHFKYSDISWRQHVIPRHIHSSSILLILYHSYEKNSIFFRDLFWNSLHLCFPFSAELFLKKGTINFIMIKITLKQLHLTSFHKCAQTFKLVEDLWVILLKLSFKHQPHSKYTIVILLNADRN